MTMREHEERKKELAQARRAKMNAKNTAAKALKSIETARPPCLIARVHTASPKGVVTVEVYGVQKMNEVDGERKDAVRGMKLAESGSAASAADKELAAWVRRREAVHSGVAATQAAAATLRGEVDAAAVRTLPPHATRIPRAWLWASTMRTSACRRRCKTRRRWRTSAGAWSSRW